MGVYRGNISKCGWRKLTLGVSVSDRWTGLLQGVLERRGNRFKGALFAYCCNKAQYHAEVVRVGHFLPVQRTFRSSVVKKGDKSVAVARQWCGNRGKVENFQVSF